MNSDFGSGFGLDTLVDAMASKIAEKVTQGLSSTCTSSITPRLLSIEEAARYLGRTKDSMQHLIAAGAIRTVRSDRRVFLDIRDLDTWIDQNKHEPIV
jgi:excisionase family DNA binding protein